MSSVLDLEKRKASGWSDGGKAKHNDRTGGEKGCCTSATFQVYICVSAINQLS